MQSEHPLPVEASGDVHIRTLVLTPTLRSLDNRTYNASKQRIDVPHAFVDVHIYPLLPPNLQLILEILAEFEIAPRL
jgi:hypothetical protein